MHDAAMQLLTAFELSVGSDHLSKMDPGVREGSPEKSDPGVGREPKDSRGPTTRKGFLRTRPRPRRGLVQSDRRELRRNHGAGEGEELGAGAGPCCPGPGERESQGINILSHLTSLHPEFFCKALRE